MRDKLCMIHAAPPERGFVDPHPPHVKYDKVFSNAKFQIGRDRNKNGNAAAPAVVGYPGWSSIVQKPAPTTFTFALVDLGSIEIPGNDKAGSEGQETTRDAPQPGAEDIALNRYAQRVDIPQPALKSGSLEKWRSRGMKPCNNFIFGLGCSKVDCIFSDGKMTSSEKQTQHAISEQQQVSQDE